MHAHHPRRSRYHPERVEPTANDIPTEAELRAKYGQSRGVLWFTRAFALGLALIALGVVYTAAFFVCNFAVNLLR